MSQYEILRSVGEGAYGSVYQCRDVINGIARILNP